MRTINVQIRDESGKLLDAQDVTIKDKDCDCTCVTLHLSKMYSNIIRTQIGSPFDIGNVQPKAQK